VLLVPRAGEMLYRVAPAPPVEDAANAAGA